LITEGGLLHLQDMSLIELNVDGCPLLDNIE
jgi:hypothetical protein